MSEPRETLSPGRQALHYVGLGLVSVGILLFLSVFVTGALSFNNGSSFSGAGSRSEPIRAVAGMVLMMGGAVLALVGRLGPAGVGIVPDPQQARRDVEPWSRAAGGMINDALESVEVLNRPDAPRAPAVRIRCRACQALNSETAKFCDQCGQPL